MANDVLDSVQLISAWMVPNEKTIRMQTTISSQRLGIPVQDMVLKYKKEQETALRSLCSCLDVPNSAHLYGGGGTLYDVLDTQRQTISAQTLAVAMYLRSVEANPGSAWIRFSKLSACVLFLVCLANGVDYYYNYVHNQPANEATNLLFCSTLLWAIVLGSQSLFCFYIFSVALLDYRRRDHVLGRLGQITMPRTLGDVDNPSSLLCMNDPDSIYTWISLRRLMLNVGRVCRFTPPPCPCTHRLQYTRVSPG